MQSIEGLFQVNLKDDPFWMLIGCILINKTQWRYVEPVLNELRAKCDDPLKLANMPGLESKIKSLGFGKNRANHLRLFAAAYARKAPKTGKDILKMPGCGPYAAQSWEIFVEQRMPSGPVLDEKIQLYLDRNYSKLTG